MIATKESAAPLRLDLEATDLSGQQRVRVTDIPGDQSVGRLVEQLVTEMDLNTIDPQGRPYTYGARSDREGRHVNAAERVADAFETGDKIRLEPEVIAGASFA